MTKINIVAVGDVMLGDQPIRMGYGVSSKINKKGIDYIFQRIPPDILEADIIFGNLETVLSDEGVIPDDLSSSTLRGSPESIPGLKKAGFTMFSMANNHAMEHGAAAFDDTVSRLVKAGIGVTGLNSETGGCCPEIIQKGELKLGFLAYSLVDPPTGVTDCPYCQSPDEEQIISDIVSLKEKVDVVVLSLHWGYEFISYPSPFQIRLAHKIVDAGAKIIIGHHPHCLQGIECYRDGIIFYSLGNSVFDFPQQKLRESIIIQCELTGDQVSSWAAIPVTINRISQPEVISDPRKIKNRIDSLEHLSKGIERYSIMNKEEYIKKAAVARRNMRYSARVSFLLNIWRFPPRYLFQSINKFISKRVSS